MNSLIFLKTPWKTYLRSVLKLQIREWECPSSVSKFAERAAEGRMSAGAVLPLEARAAAVRLVLVISPLWSSSVATLPSEKFGISQACG